MIEFVDVIALKALPGQRLWLRFSNGQEGIRDFADLLADPGPMFEPLRDQSFFERVYLDDDVPAWPNGLDLDATGLFMQLRDAGLLAPAAAAE